MAQDLREGQWVRDTITHEAGEIRQIYHDGWLRLTMEDGTPRHYNPWEVEPLPGSP
jgi:hypothetical protein